MQLSVEQWLEVAEARMRGIIVAVLAAHRGKIWIGGPHEAFRHNQAYIFQTVVGTDDNAFRRLRLGRKVQRAEDAVSNSSLGLHTWVELEQHQDGSWVLCPPKEEQRRFAGLSDEQAVELFLEAASAIMPVTV